MPSYCAVPSCKLDKYKGEKNPSTFRVPNDESLREKWIVSIPGIEFLTLNERVCEKHFEKHLLIKEYVKYDNSGKLIAQVPLAHARLKKGAVPTIFHQTIGPRSSHKILTTDHAYALRPCRSGSTSKAEAETVCVNTLNNIDIYSSDLFEYRPIVRVRRIKRKVFEQRFAIVQFLMDQKKNEKVQKVATRASPNNNIDDSIEATNIAFGNISPKILDNTFLVVQQITLEAMENNGTNDHYLDAYKERKTLLPKDPVYKLKTKVTKLLKNPETI